MQLRKVDELIELESPFDEVTTLAYNAASRVIQKTFHSGTYEVFSYDSRSRPVSIILKDSLNATLRSTSYVYDEVSNIIERTVDSVTTEFSYDDIDQLLSETRSGYSASYTYDANGNRLTRTVNSVTEDYTYDDADKLLEVKVGQNVVKEFGYDAAGRTTSIITSAGATSLSWDYEDRLTGITYPNTSTNSFGYNGFGTRVSKVDSGGTSTYMRNGVGVTAPVLTDGSATYTPGVSERRSSATTCYHADLKNGITQTDSNEDISASKQYDAFGNVAYSSGTWNGPFGYGGPFGYQSDGDSGLMLLGHRYYDSSTGRFLIRDRAKDARNWYIYCANNALGSGDDDGMRRRKLTPSEAHEVVKAAQMIGGGNNPSNEAEIMKWLDSGRILADPELRDNIWAITTFPIRGTRVIVLNPDYIPSVEDARYNLPRWGDHNLWEDRLFLASILTHELVHTRQGFFRPDFLREGPAYAEQEAFLLYVREKKQREGDRTRRERADGLLTRVQQAQK